MIDNFDDLVARCEARRRRRMIRTSLLSVSTLLLVIAGLAGFEMWRDASSVPSAPVSAPPPHAAPAAPPSRPEPAAVPHPPVKAVAAVSPAPAKPLSQPPSAPAETAAARKSLFDVNTPKKGESAEAAEVYRSQPRYETALAAARGYYEEGNYAEAAVWAKKANQHNREGEEAWLLTAKSYYAQGRKNDAIGVLELYLNYKESKAAQELLRTWKQGE